jgi:hypothetical protein
MSVGFDDHDAGEYDFLVLGVWRSLGLGKKLRVFYHDVFYWWFTYPLVVKFWSYNHVVSLSRYILCGMLTIFITSALKLNCRTTEILRLSGVQGTTA